MAKTKKPTGITIARSNYTFTCTWKFGDSDYDGGQKVQVKVNNGSWVTSLNEDKGTKKVTKYVIPYLLYYPNTSTVIQSVTFRIKGNRKSYKSKGKTINPGWSDWAEKTYTISAPIAPSVSADLDESVSNKTTFTWSTITDDEHRPITRVEYMTGLGKDGANPVYGAVTAVAASGSIPITEDTSIINDGHSYIRYFAVRALGLGGASGWTIATHVYSTPHRPTNMRASASLRSGVIDIFAQFDTWSTSVNPIDYIKMQYLITVPDEGMEIPSSASWSDGETLAYGGGSNAVRFSISGSLEEDNIIFARATTVHDNNENPSSPAVALIGKLKAPTLESVTYGSDNLIEVSATNNSSVEDSFIAVEYHDMDNVNRSYIAGIIPHGQTSVQIQCPEWEDSSHVSIGVYAVVANVTSDTREDGSTVYTLSPFANGMMKSNIVWSANVVRPMSVEVVQARTNTARVTWKWNQSDVTGVQIAWADHDDAWESTDEPETYEVSRINTPAWNISGLEAGKIWYFRLRFYIENNNSTQYGAWSNMVNLNLTSAPAVPTLVLSENIITADTEIDATWAYVTTDGTLQTYAEIREVTFLNGSVIYGDLIASTETSQKITLNTTELGWQSGETHYLALRVQSASGILSEWSPYVTLQIVDPVTCSITNTTLEPEVIDDRNILSLKEMPMTVNVLGAGNSAKTSLVIERKESYFIDRPDDTRIEGYAGEAVFVYTQTGDAEISIDLINLIGRLDDGASYRLIATVSDNYGQKATDSIDFEVHWTHQATIPYGEVSIEPDYQVAVIIPSKPANAIESDTCDIYRLSADKPVLIYPNAIFGETYIDPFPTIGEEGGYRIVLKTKNDDYITEDNRLAWTDIEGNIDIKGSIIDFDDNRVMLTRNVDIGHSWSKDFTETRYLGGSIQGDWNPAVERTASISGATITLIDQDEISAMRDLAVYANICNLRTADGSNFKCDIQVSENRSHDNGGYIATFSLNATKIDSQDYDGMTLLEWLTGIALNHTFYINNVGNLIEESESASGYTFDINSDAHLIMTVDDNALDSINFTVEDGRLVVTYFEN